MRFSYDADEAIPEQRLHAYLRARCTEYADLEVDMPLAQSAHVLVRLCCKTQTHARRCGGHLRHEPRGKGLDEPIVCSDREGLLDGPNVQRVVRGAQYGAHLEREILNALPQLLRAWCRNQTTAGPDEELVARRRAKASERATHRGGAETQS